jgi:alkylhydroperoxidase family enzyme
VGSQLGVAEEKIRALADYATSPLYTEAERVALEYADCMIARSATSCSTGCAGSIPTTPWWS